MKKKSRSKSVNARQVARDWVERQLGGEMVNVAADSYECIYPGDTESFGRIPLHHLFLDGRQEYVNAKTFRREAQRVCERLLSFLNE